MISVLHRAVFSVVACCVLAIGSPAFAQDDDADLNEAYTQFSEVLSNTNNVFFKEQVNDNGVKFYSILWDLDGQTTKFIVNIKSLGTYQGKSIYGLSGWTILWQSEDPISPAAIKAIATTNDRLTLGNFSCSEDFTTVYANMTASLDGLTPASLWMYCAYLQDNARNMADIIEEASPGSDASSK